IPAPRASARSELRWMVGPSAIGSENGTPSSSTSAPAATSACITGTVASSNGSPAVMKGIRALRPAALSAANFLSRRLIRSARLLSPPLQGEGWVGMVFCRWEGTGGKAARQHHPHPDPSLEGEGVKKSNFHAFARGDGVYVLVATAGEVAQDQGVLRQFARQPDRLGDGVAGFERRQDAFGAGELVERSQRLLVGDADVLGAAGVLEEGMLGADARVVQAGRYRMRLGDLAVVVADHVGAVAVQHAHATGRERGRVAAGVDTVARRLGADDAHRRIVEEGVEQADRIAAAADAGGDRI